MNLGAITIIIIISRISRIYLKISHFPHFFFLFFFTAFLLGIHIAGVENRDGEEWFGGWCVYLRVCVRVCMYGWTN